VNSSDVRNSEVIEVKEAVRLILHQVARKLSLPTLTPMRALFKKRFLPWCEAHQLVLLDAIRTPQLKAFRYTTLAGDWQSGQGANGTLALGIMFFSTDRIMLIPSVQIANSGNH
jgi:hypothetical protein